MKKFLSKIAIGVMAFGLLPFLFIQSAFAYPYFGPQGVDDDFLWYGNDQYPSSQNQGIELEIDETSISFQSVIATVRFDPAYINQREVTRFAIMANNRVVDWFDPAWDEDNNMWKRSYVLRIRFEPWNTGSRIALRVVAIHHGEQSPIDPEFSNIYVVGWSNEAPPFLLKDMPVVDKEAISVLEAIYALLKKILDELKGILDKLFDIEEAIKKIYEIKPETQKRFDENLAKFQAKLPTEQAKEAVKDMQRTLQDSINEINNTAQPLRFGRINWMGVTTTYALDFTGLEREIALLRDIMKFTLWAEFFFGVIFILRPRFTV